MTYRKGQTRRSVRTLKAWLPLVAMLVVGASCAPPSLMETRNGLRVEVLTNRAQFAPGDNLYLTIANRGSTAVYVDPCGFEIEGRVTDEYWSTSFGYGGCVYYEADTPPTPPVGIQPGASLLDTLFINIRSYSGSWRVHFRLLGPAREHLTSSPSHSKVFSVAGGPALSQMSELRWVRSNSDSANAFIQSRRLAHDQN